MGKLATITMPVLIEILKIVFTPERLREYGDDLLDLVEKIVKNSDNKIDDALVLPMIEVVRRAFHIEDGDD